MKRWLYDTYRARCATTERWRRRREPDHEHQPTPRTFIRVYT